MLNRERVNKGTKRLNSLPLSPLVISFILRDIYWENCCLQILLNTEALYSYLQSWTKVLTHLSKTNAFYRRSSVMLKSIFFLSIASTPSPPFQCCNTLRGHFDLVTTLERGEGVEMSKLDIEKLTPLTKQVFFGECLNYFCP